MSLSSVVSSASDGTVRSHSFLEMLTRDVESACLTSSTVLQKDMKFKEQLVPHLDAPPPLCVLAFSLPLACSLCQPVILCLCSSPSLL